MNEQSPTYIAVLDVHYTENEANVACVLFAHWTDDKPTREWTCHVPEVAPYVPGAFYLRELPCLLTALKQVQPQAEPLRAVVVDGYVWLGRDENGTPKPGLGARLYAALNETVPVIGVAKTAFAGASEAIPVLRGESQTPLYVSSVGVEQAQAALWVKQMHGLHRLPTLLKRVDSLCRQAKT